MKRSVTVKFVNVANEGKKYGNIKTTADETFMVKAGQEGKFAKGQTYDIEFEEQTWGDKTVAVVKSVGGSAPAQSAAPAPASNGDRWYMPFVSNTVAHAIASGKITDPLQIKSWAAAAKQAAMEL